MVALASLWLPILLAAVVAHIASSLLHMLVGHHAGDLKQLPQEDTLLDAVRSAAVAPGDYLAPRPASAKALKDPDYVSKRRRGPVLLLTVMSSGEMQMGKLLTQWFIYLLIVFVLTAYVACHALPTGAPYLKVFQVVGTVAFLGFAMGYPPNSIWWQHRWSSTIKYMIDGLVYALLGAGVFGWLWPR
ncbi:MAG TPA: hypothetical protein VGL28_05090 [Steroidobacteraceae bacterium]|jgi:hypothetical protein